MWRRAAWGGVLLVWLAIPAAAADMPVKARPLVANCWAGEFQGPHAGAFVAGSAYRPLSTETSAFFFTGAAPSFAQTNFGGGGGINVGYDVQCGNRLFGVEADWTFGRVTSSPFAGLFPIIIPVPGSTLSAASTLKGYGTLRTRAGIVADNLLMYATGGLAYARSQTTYRFTVPGLLDTQQTFNEGRVGWAAGWGAEYAFRPGWHLRAEALYLNFRERTHSADLFITPFPFAHSDSIWTARLGVSAELDPQRGTSEAVRDAFASMRQPTDGRFAGFYVGGHIGFTTLASTSSDRDFFLAVPAESSVGTHAVGGIQAGYNIQYGHAVFGAEADWSFGKVTNRTRYGFFIPDSDLSVSNQINGFGTLRGRAGIAADDLMIYLTGGAAIARTKAAFDVVTPPIPADNLSTSATRWGWTTGFGAEWALDERVSFKGEMLYVGLKDHPWTGESLFLGTQRFNNSDSFWTGRLGVNVKLDPDHRTPVRAVAARCGTGRFQGAHIGGFGNTAIYRADRTDSDLFTFAPNAFHQTGTDYGGGIQAGYDVQCGQKVFGVEGDWSFGKSHANTAIDDLLASATVTSRLKNFSTVRGRAGIAFDNLLLYVTAGAAAAKIHTEWTVAGGGPGFDETLAFDKWRVGWTAGLGTEWAVLPNVSIKSEVLYADFGQSVVTTFSQSVGDFENFTHSDSVWTARVGVNVKLH